MRPSHEHRVVDDGIPRDVDVVEYGNLKDVGSAHDPRGARDILLTRVGVAAWMIVREDHCRGACCKRRSEEPADVEACDVVLSADGHDVCAGHAVLAVDEKAGEVFAVGVEEARRVDEVVDTEQTTKFMAERRAALSKLTKLRNKIRKTENDLEVLSYEIADANRFVSYLAELSEKLPRAQASAEMIGNIEFTHCPACLTLLEQPSDSAHCSVCGAETDREREQSRYLSIRLDIDIQAREAKQLLLEKEGAHSRFQRDIRELNRENELLLADFGSKYDISISPRESYLASKHQRLGQISREKEYLGRLRECALEVRRLSDEKARLQVEITKLTDRLKALEVQSQKRRSVALTSIADIARSLLHSDLERQKEFKAANIVSIRFGDNALTVDHLLQSFRDPRTQANRTKRLPTPH